MKNASLCSVVLSFVACIWYAPFQATAHAAPQAPAEQQQQFTVLRTGRLVAGTESPTNAEANCSIAGMGGAATLECRPSGASARAQYHFNTALIVGANGTAYVIGCRVPLLPSACRKLDTGSVVEGHIEKGMLLITDKGKVRPHLILASANVGALPAQAAVSSKCRAARSL